MPKLDIRKLESEGAVRVEERVRAPHAILEGTDLDFPDGLQVDLRASGSGSGEIVVRGTLEGELRAPCRRCLTEVRRPFSEEVTIVFAAIEDLDGEDLGEVRPMELDTLDLDLSEAIREELILSAPNYIVCDEECKGLCPLCGVNRNVETCDCTVEEPDPRWDALRTLKQS